MTAEKADILDEEATFKPRLVSKTASTGGTGHQSGDVASRLYNNAEAQQQKIEQLRAENERLEMSGVGKPNISGSQKGVKSGGGSKNVRLHALLVGAC